MTSISRRSNAPGLTLFASEARTATPNPAMFSLASRAVEVVVDITAIVATPLITVNIERQDPASGKWVLLLASAALAAVATTRLRVSPHLTAAANLVAQDHPSGNLRVRPVHGDADSATYSIGVIPLE